MFYVAITAFTLGVAIATGLSVALSTAIWIAVLGLTVAIIARHSNQSTTARYLPLVAVTFLMLAAGLLRTELFETQFTSSQFTAVAGGEFLFSGVINKEPDVRERSAHLYVASAGETILVTVNRHEDISYGDEILISGTIDRPESFETELGRTFDYPNYLLAREVQYIVRYADVAVLSKDKGNPFIAGLLAVKEMLTTGIESVIPEPQAGLSVGLLLGIKQALGDDLEKAFRQSGIIHIVVLSGYNVMLVVAFFSFFFKRLPRFWRFSLGLLAVAGFGLLVGLSATVLRASIMAGLVLFATTFSRSYDVMRALFFAGFVMLLLNPYLLLFDIGFQLSFMATLGLLLVAPKLESTLAEGNWFGVKEFFLATVATQIAVLPLLLYHIGEISLVAVVVNILVLPIVPLAMFGTFISGMIALISLPLGSVLGYITASVLLYIILVATWFSSMPFATLVVPAFSGWFVPVLYVAMGFFYYVIKVRLVQIPGELAGWEVVEETEFMKKMSKKGAAQRAAPEKDIPIYFR